MIGYFYWRCHHVLDATQLPCLKLNSVECNTREPEGKVLVCARCQTPPGVEVLARNTGR